MRICTWNSQGNPLHHDIKKRILANLLTIERCDVVMIQECGDYVYLGGEGYYFYRADHAGALHNRCNTCMISRLPNRVSFSQEILPSGTGRSYIELNTGNCLYFYTLHASAGDAAKSDVMYTLSKARNNFIIGGDMNCTPYNLCPDRRKEIFAGTARRSHNHAIIKHTSMVTHPGTNAILDYFIIDEMLRYSYLNIERYSLQGGDHYPVILEIIC